MSVWRLLFSFLIFCVCCHSQSYPFKRHQASFRKEAIVSELATHKQYTRVFSMHWSRVYRMCAAMPHVRSLFSLNDDAWKRNGNSGHSFMPNACTDYTDLKGFTTHTHTHTIKKINSVAAFKQYTMLCVWRTIPIVLVWKKSIKMKECSAKQIF